MYEKTSKDCDVNDSRNLHKYINIDGHIAYSMYTWIGFGNYTGRYGLCYVCELLS